MAVYYAANPGAGEIEKLPTLTEAIILCQEWLEVYRGDIGDEGWSEDVSGIAVYRTPRVSEDPLFDGTVVAKAEKQVLAERPDDVVDGWSKSDSYSTYWGTFTAIVEYSIQRVPSPPPNKE